MEDKSVDLIVTDPPYNLNYTGRGEIAEQFDNDNLDDKSWSVWFNNKLNTFNRTLKDDTAIYIWIDWRHYPEVFKLTQHIFDIKNCIVWNKNNFGMGQHYRFQHEFCIYAIKGKHKLRLFTKNESDVWNLKKDNVNLYRHPTQKPTSTMHKPIELSSDKESLVFDPFLGSGTTAVACEKLGRQWIGVEISEKYCEIAAKRINAEASQGKLF